MLVSEDAASGHNTVVGHGQIVDQDIEVNECRFRAGLGDLRSRLAATRWPLDAGK